MNKRMLFLKMSTIMLVLIALVLLLTGSSPGTSTDPGEGPVTITIWGRDVLDNAPDHAYDALRYLIMSRPRMDHPHDRMLRIKEDLYKPADTGFGY